ncbi:MAG: hypothetical protein AAGG44_07110 [Planctomycetota bacterium]
MPIRNPRVGDKVVFAKEKHSGRPGQRAQEVSASQKGDHYSYIVEKYWVVMEVREDGSLLLATRRGKKHELPADHPNLRPASFFERVLLRQRFPSNASASKEPDADS